MEIRFATTNDIEGIKALLKKYHTDTISDEDRKDGFVTTNITDAQLTDLIHKDGVMLAVDNGTVLGFAFAADWKYWSQWPFFRHMIEIIPGHTYKGIELTAENTYQYGPMCIDKSIRGSGTFEKVFKESLRSMKDKFPVMLTFVNKVNGRSYNAHSNKAHLDTLDSFDFNNNHYYLMGCMTDME